MPRHLFELNRVDQSGPVDTPSRRGVPLGMGSVMNNPSSPSLPSDTLSTKLSWAAPGYILDRGLMMVGGRRCCRRDEATDQAAADVPKVRG